jgi:electron transfer flavoprotein beta subunit
MKIAVCVKQVLDCSVALRVVDGAVQQGCRRRIAHLGAADLAALEEAVDLRSRCDGAVTAISAGQGEAIEALRFCAACGADRLVHLQRADHFDPTGAAMAVAGTLQGGRFDVVFCGRKSGDGASGYFPAVLASLLDWPLVTAVAALSVQNDGALRLERRLERGDREIVRCPLPAVLACEPLLDAYRYVPVRALRRAMTVPIETVPSTAHEEVSCELIALEPAKPRPKRASGPDPKASPMDRLTHLLSGGVKRKQNGGFVQGNPDTVAAEIVRFLEEKGFLKP